ncbi:penicillin-insensitive murein endopeptidase [Fluviicola sp.]|uniref:penicillin-insensitive murein endopeptidase n=1 Tax=Fluviicola sp. TaxID=1917219 RepID=UPI002608E6DA|nr:penicillin-insensitive murein endopeptidase [Fluviicola sp.]
MRKCTFLLFPLVLIQACSGQTPAGSENPQRSETALPAQPEINPIQTLYDQYKDRTKPSTSVGTVSKGGLKNGRLFPFNGPNFVYFDSTSYLEKHAFVHQKVYQTVLNTYQKFEQLLPSFEFGLMECSNEHGGKIWPHRTHQNGLSVDFMSPLLKDGISTTDFNSLGLPHYLMDFDDNGVYAEDERYRIDFNLLARHLLELNEQAHKNGLKIEKVILKIALKDELFATEYGRKLKNSGIYFATKLSELIDCLHDDHYHVDFGISEK